ELLAPPVIRKLRHADQTDRFSDRTTLRQQNIDLAQLRHDLFGFVLLLGHSNVLLRLNSLLQGGPLFRGQTIVEGGKDAACPACYPTHAGHGRKKRGGAAAHLGSSGFRAPNYSTTQSFR